MHRRGKPFTVVLLLLCIFLSIGGARPARGADGPQDGSSVGLSRPLLLSEGDDGQWVTVQVGRTIELVLKAHPSTGFTWQFVSLDGSFLEVVDRRFQPGSGLIGAPGWEHIRLRVLREGRTTLRLVYRRPWESTVPPARSFSVQVRAEGRWSPPPLSEPSPTPASPTGRPPEVSPASSGSASPDLPSAFDWRDRDGVTPVKNQGGCGSCWAFATVGVMESALKIWAGVEADLSEQYLVAHNEEGWSCDGGRTAHDYHISKRPVGEREAGAVLESECPYTATDDKCPGPQPMRHPYTLDGWASVPNSVTAIKEAIYRYGPVWTTVCSGPAFHAYSGGVFETDESDYCSGGTNHAVVLVGWDDTQGINGVWILRNSWGSGWGDNGYMLIGYGISNVGTNTNHVVYDGTSMEPVVRMGGEAKAVDVGNGYAYLAMGSRLAVLDVSDPSHPSLKGISEPMLKTPSAIHLSGSFAYVAAGSLRVFDVSTPTDPQEVGGFDPPSYAEDVVVSGTLAYLAAGAAGDEWYADFYNLFVLDVNDPANPQVVGGVKTPGYAWGIAVSGGYAYVATGSEGVTVVDVLTPSAPTVITTTSTPGYAYDVDVAGGYAYVADGGEGLTVIDVSDPSTPSLVTSVDVQGTAARVTLTGHYAYVARRYSGLAVVDVSNPLSPTIVESFTTPGQAYDVAIHGNHAYVADGTEGLRVLNVAEYTTTSVDLYEEGRYESLGEVEDLIAADGLAYLALGDEEIQIFDISSPLSPTLTGAYTQGGEVLDLDFPYLYVAGGYALRVLEVSDPAAPSEVGSVYMGWANDIDVEGAHAYLTAGSSGLKIVDISNPASPHELGSLDTSGYANGVAVSGGYAYIAAAPVWDGSSYSGGGLYIVDVSTPLSPTQVAFYDSPAYTTDVAVSDSYVYLTETGLWSGGEWIRGGLHIIDVSTPSAPQEVAYIPADVYGVEVARGFAYVYTYSTVMMFDVRDPENPLLLGSVAFPDNVGPLTVSDDYLWAGGAGLKGVRRLWDKVTGYIPTSGGSVRSKAGDTALSFPAGAFGEEAVVTYRHLWEDPSVPDLSSLGHTFSVAAVSHTSGQPVSPALSYSALLTYTPGLFDEDTIALYGRDGDRWEKEPSSTVDKGAHRLGATPDHLGEFSVLGIVPPISITVQGIETGCIHMPAIFTATVYPLTSTQPITYAWRATEQGPVTRVDGATNSISLTWSLTGTKKITVTASNNGGTVTDVYEIAISGHALYLPLVIRDG